MDWKDMAPRDRFWWFLSRSERKYWAGVHKRRVENAFVAEHQLTDVLMYDEAGKWARKATEMPPMSRLMKKVMGIPLTPREELTEIEEHEVSRALAEKRRAGVRVVTYAKGSITPEGRSGFEMELKRFGLNVIWLEYSEGVADPSVGKL